MEKLKNLLINDNILSIGDLSFRRYVVKDKDKSELVIQGMLSIHDYIEQLDTVETDRYILKGIFVYEEDYGSNDIRITYKFYAKELEIKGKRRLYDKEKLKELEEERWREIHGQEKG